VAFGEELAPVPGHRELLGVLWEMGILPEVRVLPGSFGWPERRPRSREEAVQFAVDALEPRDEVPVRARVEDSFAALFALRDDGSYRPLWRPPSRGMLLTWETANPGV
jgi:hypothetical protein